MSITTVDVDKVELVIKAVIEDWVKQHDWAVIVSERSLRELYSMLVDELKSIHVEDKPTIRVSVIPYTKSTITVYLPNSWLTCVATFTAGDLHVYGDAKTGSERVSVLVVPRSPVEVVCQKGLT